MVIGICDDESGVIEFIEDAIRKYYESHEIDCSFKRYNSGEELLENSEDIQEIDVVFLDVNMKDIDGIKTAQKIRELSNDIFIAFITSFIEYSTQGYTVNAIRYIVKGESERTKELIYECLDAVCKEKTKKNRQKKLLFKFMEGESFVDVKKVMYVESTARKLTFYIDEGKYKKYSLYGKLDDIENVIVENDFCRIHKSSLINMNYIKSYSGEDIIMEDGKILHVPRAKNKQVRQKYTLFLGRKM